MTHSDSSIRRETAEGLDLAERTRLMRDGLINNAGPLVSGLVGIVLVPLMLKGLGSESYGLWIVAMTVVGMFAVLNSGVYWALAREVASSPDSSETLSFVEGAANAYLLLGTGGALMLGLLGYPLSSHLHLDSQTQRIAHGFFWILALGFLTDQLNAWGGAVLIGLRRFDFANLIGTGVAIGRAVGIVILLAMGASLTSLALWQTIVLAASAVVVFSVVKRLVPQLRFQVGRLHWKNLRRRLSFALSSVFASVIGRLIWQSGALLIGFVLGSAQVVPFNVGQKFPFAISCVGWQVAGALFPAASEDQQPLSRAREILRFGTRSNLVLMLPLSILLWVVAPNLLSVWMGQLDPEALHVLRLLSVVVLAEGLMAAPYNILLGRGAIQKIALTIVGVALGTICLTLALLSKIGVTGAAWGILLPVVAGAGLLFYLTCRECQASWAPMVGSLFRGLLLPGAGCAITAYLVSVWAGQGLGPLAEICFAGSVVYLLGLYFAPGQIEEKQFLRIAFRQARSLMQLADHSVRRIFY